MLLGRLLYFKLEVERKDFTLTVIDTVIEKRSGVEANLQVYSGSCKDSLRYVGRELVPRKSFVAEKALNPFGRVSFTLKPGHYCLYPAVDPDTVKTGSLGAGAMLPAPHDVYVDKDMEITPLLYFIVL